MGQKCLLALKVLYALYDTKSGLVSRYLFPELEERLMATAKTPGKIGAKERAMSWSEVRVFGRWCKGCGLCIAFCPPGVFEARDDGHPQVRFPQRCTGCEWCEFHCPDMAIEVIRHPDDQPTDGN